MELKYYAEVVQIIPTDNYKVYCYFDTGHIKLYDLENIPEEFKEVYRTNSLIQDGTLAIKINDRIYDIAPEDIFENGIETSEDTIKEITDLLTK